MKGKIGGIGSPGQLERLGSVGRPGGRREGEPSSRLSFDKVLAQVSRQKRSVKISAHAEARLRQRKIILSGEDMERIEGAVEKMREKGAKESLLLMKDLALLVNVKNRTVITALDGENMKDKVFTNIDSAIII